MKMLRARSRDEAGQVIVFVAFILTALVGMAALVVDVGSWYRADRHLQTAADAAALAGAQELPTKPSTAVTVAMEYGTVRNGRKPDGSAMDGLSVMPTIPQSDTIHVSATAKAPGFFARVISAAYNEVTVKAEAEAQVFAPEKLKNVAPIAVYKDMETDKPCTVLDPTCFGMSVTLNFDEDAAFDPTKSKFGLLDLDRDGSAGAGDMKKWLENGYPDYLPINTDYPPANGEKNGIQSELKAIAKQNADADEPDKRVLLLPVYDSANASTGYHVIGWAAFVIDAVGNWNGHDHELTGHFVTFIATDVAAGGTIPDPNLDFGVHVITLTH
jgi:Putative Flp pilus-assembly TadE/G-like